MMIPLSEGIHKNYFDRSPGDHQAHLNGKKILADKDLNHPFENQIRKAKIFKDIS